MLEITHENKSTTQDNIPAILAGDYLPADKPDRLINNAYDDDYITEYLRYPEKGKRQALERAGHPNPTRQFAWRMHDRLSDRIDKALDKLIKQDAALGRATLVSLCKSSQSDSVRAACAAKLMEYADKTKPQRIIHETANVEDIDKEIEQIQERIKAGMNVP